MFEVFTVLAVVAVVVFAVSVLLSIILRSKKARGRCLLAIAVSAVCGVFCISKMFQIASAPEVETTANVDNPVDSVEKEILETEQHVASEATSSLIPATEAPASVPDTEAQTDVPAATPALSSVPSRSVASAYKSDIIVASKLTLDRFISDYSVSLAEQNWTVADFDSDGAVMALASVKFKSSGETASAILVLTPIIENGKVNSATPHYVAVGDTVYGDDGYCDDTFATIEEALASFEATN